MKTKNAIACILIAGCSAGPTDEASAPDEGLTSEALGAAPAHPCADHLGAKPWEGAADGFHPCTGNLALELAAGPVTLVHNSRDAATLGPAGYGVRLALRDRLVPGGDGSVTRVLGDGETVVYLPHAGGGFDAPSDTQATLSQVGASYVLRMPGNSRLTYTRPNGAAWVMTSFQDRIGNTMTITVDAADRETAVTDHLGNQTRLAWSNGQLASVTDAEGMVWSMQYDGAKQLVAIRAPAVGGMTPTSTYAYDTSHHIIEQRSATGTLVGGYAYLADGSLAGWIEPSGRSVAVTYGAASVSVGDGFGDVTTYQFSAAGELAARVAANGITSDRYAYDARHRIVTSTDWLGRVTSYQYNAQDDVTRVTDRYGKATTYSYDARHNPLAVTDAAGKTSTYTYDANDLVLTIDDPSGRHEAYQRAANGNLNAVIGSDGKTLASYVYGARGEVLQERDADGRLTAYSYDAFLNTTAVTAPDGTVTSYASSRLGRLLSETSPGGEVRSYVYDQAHRMIGTHYENQGADSWFVDADGRITSITSNAGPAAKTWSGSYLLDGRLGTTTYNGTVDQAAAAALNVPPVVIGGGSGSGTGSGSGSGTGSGSGVH